MFHYYMQSCFLLEKENKRPVSNKCPSPGPKSKLEIWMFMVLESSEDKKNAVFLATLFWCRWKYWNRCHHLLTTFVWCGLFNISDVGASWQHTLKLSRGRFTLYHTCCHINQNHHIHLPGLDNANVFSFQTCFFLTKWKSKTTETSIMSASNYTSLLDFTSTVNTHVFWECINSNLL